jgi:chemotaxis protein methyltransferase CheR
MRKQADESEAYDFIIDLIYERCRIRLHEGKQELIRARLGKRMRFHGFSALTEYCEYLRDSGDEDEITRAVDALTTNFTNFLRESEHFEFMVTQALPSLPASQKRFSVWSAACSSGEEPYSIAFYLFEQFPPSAGRDWRILATDISTKALGKAEQAVYDEQHVSAIPAPWLRRYFQRGHGNWEGSYRVKPWITERVTFRHLNLLSDYNIADPFSIIFCRNVMIYFDRPTQQQLVDRLTRQLVPGGYLFVGHSESLAGIKSSLRSLRPSIYQKV